MLLETVIVPFDFSKRCRMAAQHAAAVARRFEAKLVFLHVIPYSNYEYAAFESGAYVGASWPAEADIRRKLDEDARATLGASTPIELVIERGDPPGKIEEVSGRYSKPILVMPTHGFGAFRRFLLGSVTTKVLHDVQCPVYTGAHLQDSPVFTSGEANRVACAIDLREHSEAVLAWAAEYAAQWGAELTVIHAVNWLETEPLDHAPTAADYDNALRAAAEQHARELIARVGCQADLRIGVGGAAAFVPEAVRESGADVLVVGRSLERGMMGRLREHAYKLIRESPCPVISV